MSDESDETVRYTTGIDVGPGQDITALAALYIANAAWIGEHAMRWLWMVA